MLGSSRQLVANLIFAGSAEEIVWTKAQLFIRYAVELHAYKDNYAFVYVSTLSSTPTLPSQLLKLEANSGDDTYVDLAYKSPTETFSVPVEAVIRSKKFELFDSELLKIDIDMERSVENPVAPNEFAIRIFADNFSMTEEKIHLVNPSNQLYLLPIGTHGRVFQLRFSEDSNSSFTANSLDFYFNRHGHRRV